MAIEYRFQKSTSPSGPWTNLTGTWWTSPAQHASQPTGDYLYYRIVVKDSDVNNVETASEPIAVLVADQPVLTATGGVGASHIELSWTPACFGDYLVYRFNRATLYWDLIATVVGDSHDDYNVSQDVNYCYYIVPRTHSGIQVDRSNIACAMVTPEGVFSMRSRASVYQGIQIGIETIPGAAVPCTKRLLGMELTLNPQIPVKTVKYQGAKGATGTQHGQEFTEGSFTGAMDFNLLYYLFSLMFGASTDTVDGTVDIHNWKPSDVIPLTPKTGTIEQGSSMGAERVSFGVVREIMCTWSREDASIDGSLFGQFYNRNITLTPGLPEVASLPIHPVAIGVYISLNGTDWTLLEDTIDGEFRLGGLWKPSFHVNDTVQTFDRIVEQLPEFGATITVEDGTETDDFMSHLYSGQKIWIGIKALGPEIEAGKYHELKLYMPVYVVVPDFGDKDSVHGSTFSFEMAHDATFGMADITVKNNLNAL